MPAPWCILVVTGGSCCLTKSATHRMGRRGWNMGRRISMATRKELVEAVRQRYSAASKLGKSKILDEFAALTGYHRKHAIRVLAGVPCEHSPGPGRNRLY